MFVDGLVVMIVGAGPGPGLGATLDVNAGQLFQ
jgi:hypothetical protein